PAPHRRTAEPPGTGCVLSGKTQSVRAAPMMTDLPDGRSDDAALVAASLRDPNAFAAVYDRYARMVHRYVARRLDTRHADDLLGQTFLIAFERRATFDPTRGSVRSWLLGIATMLLRRHRRDEARMWRAYERAATTGTPPPDSSHDADDLVARVDAASMQPTLARLVGDLPERERNVLLLFAWADLSYAEIATALDIPLGTVRSCLHRLRNRLRAELPAAAKEAESDGRA
ncbi:MAG: RNA polymerase sigma factor, partial [Nocardioidaceae bacterium]